MNQTEDDLWIGLIEALGFFIKIAGDAIKEIIILELMPFINVSIKGSFYIIINIREFPFYFLINQFVVLTYRRTFHIGTH